jgi:hypothetical protein
MYPVHHAQTISPFAFSGKPEAGAGERLKAKG